MKLFISFAVAFIALTGCSEHNAKAPLQKIASHAILQDSSTFSIPIQISNEIIRSQVMAGVPNPLSEATTTIKIPVINTVTVPHIFFTKEITKVACDIPQQISIGHGWKCVACPPCCLATVIVHSLCDQVKTVEHVVTEDIINKINMDIPVYYKAVLNDIRFEGNRDTFYVHVKIDFALRADVDTRIIKTLIASCGINEPMPQVELVLSSIVKFGDNASLVLSNKSWGLKWNHPCNLTALDISVENLMSLPIIKGLIEKKINDLVQNKVPGTVSFLDKITKEWPIIAGPIKLGELGVLQLNIGQINTSSLLATADTLEAEISAVCKPQILLDIPKKASLPTLPAIKSAGTEKDFDVNLLASFPIDSLNQYLKDNFRNVIQKVDNNIVQIESIHLYQSDDKLVVQVDLEKPFEGKIYLWGIPKLDIATSTLSFDQLDYTEDSKSMIADVAGWMLKLPAVENVIRTKFQYHYKKDLQEQVRKFADFRQALSPNVSFIGQLKNVGPVALNISDNTVNAVVNLKGNILLQIR